MTNFLKKNFNNPFDNLAPTLFNNTIMQKKKKKKIMHAKN